MFAAVTGANGAVGEGIISQLLRQFPPQHFDLHILLLCRSEQKAEGVRRKMLDLGLFSSENAVSGAKRKIAPDSLEAKLAKERLIFVECDLSSLERVKASCQIIRKVLSENDSSEAPAALDFLFLNAGIMPTEGVNIMLGLKNLCLRPGYVARTGGDIMTQTLGQTTSDGMYGYTFMCNTFGHYAMLREMEELLAKSKVGGRVIWCSSTTAVPEFFDEDDWQCLNGSHPYESSKRLCELLSMSSASRLREKGIFTFISSPGNVLSALTTSQASAILVSLGLYIMRFCGCSGINITGENAATSAIWLATQPDPDSLDPNLVYHSDITIFGKLFVKKLEISSSEKDLRIGREISRKLDLIIKSSK